MSDEPKDQQQAIEQLERRVATLENMIRRLTFAGQSEQRPARTPVRRQLQPHAAAPSLVQPRTTDLEQWFGQRGLLAVGVAALIIATALFLKYAFDHGWVSPFLRSMLAIVAGLGIAVWGHERIGKEMRRYGAALIGAGGGLIYLGVWAAAGPYGLVERRLGVLILAATTVAFTVVALHHALEGLAIWALFGAYLAPLLLRPVVPQPEAFLGYLEVVGLGTAILAYTMSWRRTFTLAVFGYLLLAAFGAAPAVQTAAGCWLIAAGGLLTLHVTRLRPWREARVGVVFLVWIILGTAFDGLRGLAAPEQTRWLALGAAVAVSGLLWWQHFVKDPFAAGARDLTADHLLFVANPLIFLLLAAAPAIPVLREGPAIVPALLGAAYLSAGWLRRSSAFLTMGFGLAAFGMAAAGWQPATVTIGWTFLAIVALAAERDGGRPGGRSTAAGLAAAAFVYLFTAAIGARQEFAPVFTDPWALALYAYVAATAAAARWWGRGTWPAEWKLRGAEFMWFACAAAVFVGGSIQFFSAFARLTELAANLALSVWWLLYAGALVWLGFRMERKFVRSAGLAVAAGAGLKIVLYDLSQLEALYRVGSFFALAMIALAVAFAYNRRAKASAA